MVKLDSVNKLLLKSILYSEEALQTNFKFHHWAIYLLPCTSGEKKGKERKEKKKKKKSENSSCELLQRSFIRCTNEH